MLTVSFELERVNNALTDYIRVGRKLPEDAVRRQSIEFAYQVSQQFFALAPERGVASGQAKSLNFALGRRGAGGQLTPAARRLAERYMGGQKSIMGRVLSPSGGEGFSAGSQGAAGTALLRSVRIGKKGKRIYGGREGRGGRAATRSEALKFRSEGEVWLNRRAVETYFSIMLRERGRGSLGASWLKAWRAMKAHGIERGFVGGEAGETKWTADWALSALTNGVQWRLTNTMPGIGKFPEAVAGALAATTDNMREYIERKGRQFGREAR